MKRRKAREQAFVFIFERCISQASIRDIIDDAEEAADLTAAQEAAQEPGGTVENPLDAPIEEFAEHLACGVEENTEEVDAQIRKYIRGWSMDRLSKVSLALLRLALYEILYEKDIPVSVSINEAVALAKKYGAAADAPFVNGVLGSAAKTLEEPENA